MGWPEATLSMSILLCAFGITYFIHRERMKAWEAYIQDAPLLKLLSEKPNVPLKHPIDKSKVI